MKNIIWRDGSKLTQNGIFNRQVNQYFTRVSDFPEQCEFNVVCAIRDNQVVAEELHHLHTLKEVKDNYLDRLKPQEFRKLFFLQDGAPSHCSKMVNQFSDETFDDR